MKAVAVIGAGFGDEGKGAMVDRLAAPYGEDALVVRFNGGAQAGHTVVAPDGRRHVFSHFGAGSFSGAPTWLSRFFAVNPILHRKEAERLAALGVSPVLFVDPRCDVTTPYDMIINQMAEEMRGQDRHGSVGVGYGETIERHTRAEFATSAGILHDRHAMRATLRRIRDEWVPARLARLGIYAVSPERLELLRGDGLIEHFVDDALAFRDGISLRSADALAGPARIVFEGAQGLLLDQDRGWFPYVTRSNTGLKNVLSIAKEAGIAHIDAIYATRGYKTRHGAGPLPHETAEYPWPGIRDETNIHNDWQGSLRFGLLDIDRLAKDIRTDLGDADGSGIRVSHSLAVTCLDQAPAEASFIRNGVMRKSNPLSLAREAGAAAGVSEVHCGVGAERHATNLERIRLNTAAA